MEPRFVRSTAPITAGSSDVGERDTIVIGTSPPLSSPFLLSPPFNVGLLTDLSFREELAAGCGGRGSGGGVLPVRRGVHRILGRVEGSRETTQSRLRMGVRGASLTRFTYVSSPLSSPLLSSPLLSSPLLSSPLLLLLLLLLLLPLPLPLPLPLLPLPPQLRMGV